MPCSGSRHGKKAEHDITACVYQERLVDMPEEDVQAEGGLWLSKQDFIVQNGWEESKVLWVVRFQKTTYR
jgi:hypothetical protein